MLVTQVLEVGASIVKWTKKVLRYMKAMIFLVKCLKVVAKCCYIYI